MQRAIVSASRPVVQRAGARNMSGGGDMFKKKLDFAKDSVVPSSSWIVFAGCFSFAIYGLASGI
jgi:hypothetical protein